ncbi:DUF4384 domain-containing protein [Deltaproteobacteria bacterium TL4]
MFSTIMRLLFKVGVGLCLWTFSHTTLYAETCYVLIKKAGNFDPKIIEASSISLMAQHVEPVEPPPYSGIRSSDCAYTVSVSESMQGFLVLISGRKINAMGNSRIPGLDGVNQAMLRAFYRTVNPQEQQQICTRYPQLMKEDCKTISATIFFFDGQGRMIEEGSTVKKGDEFNVMLKPDGDLYAYVLNQDTQGNFFRIFPNQEVSPQTNPLKDRTSYTFPTKTSGLIFSFDENTGEEHFFFILSASPLDDLDELFLQLEQAKSEKARNDVLPLLVNAVRSRGMALKNKKTPVQVPSSQTNIKLEAKIGELVEGKGALVKTVRLNHIR